jgi:hypothetical protein
MSNIPPKEMSLEEIEKILGYKVKIVPRTRTQVVNVPVGEVFRIGDYEFVVLRNGVKVLALSKDLIGESVFDKESNCYEHSELHMSETLKKFQKHILTNVSQRDLLSRKVNLMADNGYEDYAVSIDNAAPMTLDEFRLFSDVIERYEVRDDWWLVTPHGTLKRNESKSVCYVDKNNMIEHAKCDTIKGIRPMICLNCSTVVGYDGEKLN